jgi:hypothetical protein
MALRRTWIIEEGQPLFALLGVIWLLVVSRRLGLGEKSETMRSPKPRASKLA